MTYTVSLFKNLLLTRSPDPGSRSTMWHARGSFSPGSSGSLSLFSLASFSIAIFNCSFLLISSILCFSSSLSFFILSCSAYTRARSSFSASSISYFYSSLSLRSYSNLELGWLFGGTLSCGCWMSWGSAWC
jgi:hypothetical protein